MLLQSKRESGLSALGFRLSALATAAEVQGIWRFREPRADEPTESRAEPESRATIGRDLCYIKSAKFDSQ